MSSCTKIEAGGISFSYKYDPVRSADLNIRHCHDTYELLYVAQGHGRYLVEGTEFPLLPRTLVLIRPFEYHCVEIGCDGEYERYVIQFSLHSLSEDVASLLSPFLTDAGGSGCFYPPDLFPQGALSVYDRFEAAASMPEEDKAIYLRLLLSELLLFLSLSSSRKILHNEMELGARVIKYINDYLDTDVSLDRLARRFFVSKYYLCRTFKKYSGTSVHSYINQKRVMYAKQLIESGESASGAAYRVGFGDYSAFYRAYVKILGEPPTAAMRPAEGEDDAVLREGKEARLGKTE